MTRSRILTVLLAALLAAALVAAGCGGDDDDSGDSAEVADLAGLHAGPARDPEAGDAHRGDRRPRVPPYFEDNDPTNGAGSRAPSRTRSPTSSASTARTSTGSSSRSTPPMPRAEGLRLRRQPDLDHPEARRAGRLLVLLLHRHQAVVAAKDSEAAKATSLDDLKGATIGVQIGTTSLDAVDAEIAPDDGAPGVQ